MAGSGERPQVQLRGLRRRGGVQGAVLVLQGASRAEVQRAAALGALLSDRCLLVAVNGGLRSCRASRRRPDLFVGDGDSSNNIPSGIPAVFYPKDKNFSDLAGALGEMHDRRVQVVVLAGLLGGRLDHEWANLLELGAHAKGFAGILAPTDRGTVLVTGRGCKAVTVRNRMVSLVALGQSATVSLRGTHWTLHRKRIRPGSLGLSNITGAELNLSVHTGVVALVFPFTTGKSRKS